MPARIFLIDSMALVRLGLKNIIDSIDGLEVCGEAGDASTALQMLPNCLPDLCVMDMYLSGKNQTHLIGQINLLMPNCKILVSTLRDELVYAEKTIAMGADGFISKNEPQSVFESALANVLLGKTFISDKVHRAMFESLRLTTDGSNQSLQIRTLSTRELEVFELIGRGCGPPEIAADLSISTKTVESHRQNIRNKLGCKNMSELICCAAVWAVQAC